MLVDVLVIGAIFPLQNFLEEGDTGGLALQGAITTMYIMYGLFRIGKLWGIGFVMRMLAGLLALIAILGYLWMVWKLPDIIHLTDGQQRHNSRVLVISLATPLVLASGIVFTARTYWLSQRGQVTERFTKAVDALTSSEPEVRIGAVYALAHVMADSRVHHNDVLEVLEEFIRRNAASSSLNSSKETWLHPVTGSDPLPRELRHDVQAALTVLAHRPWRAERRVLNLSKLHLVGADLRSARLAEANLAEADLTGADLEDANLYEADMRGAKMVKVNLQAADLERALLVGSDLSGSDLWAANLRKSELAFSKLVSATLWAAEFDGSSLIGANMSNAFLAAASFKGADLRFAVLANAHLGKMRVQARVHATFGVADLRLAKGLTKQQIQSARTGTTKLPKELY